MNAIDFFKIREKTKSKGQSVVEYALILGGIVFLVILAIHTFGDTLKSYYDVIISNI